MNKINGLNEIENRIGSIEDNSERVKELCKLTNKHLSEKDIENIGLYSTALRNMYLFQQEYQELFSNTQH